MPYKCLSYTYTYFLPNHHRPSVSLQKLNELFVQQDRIAYPSGCQILELAPNRVYTMKKFKSQQTSCKEMNGKLLTCIYPSDPILPSDRPRRPNKGKIRTHAE
ncbi:hypothetical protein PTI98_006106 [Pleurotus ostreatus]|nr:hypothetical protein PTI98_006106 [Pleurotus ostreatus]